MFRFLHAADIHLDSKQENLPEYPGAPRDDFQLVTRRAFENLVKLAIERKVAFVLIAGDLADGDWRDQRTLLWLQGQTAILRDSGIKVVLIQGNHDAQNQMTKGLSWTDNVRMLSTTRPETYTIEDVNVKIHGQGFAKRAVLEDLSTAYPKVDTGCFNIGMLHTSAGGYEGHQPYAPCTLDGLRAHGYQYWALGHVHTRCELLNDPWIVFPGITQGRHIRESGPKGCTIVEVNDSGEVQSLEEVSLDVVRWEQCKVDITGVEDVDALLGQVGTEIQRLTSANDTMPLALRIELTGVCKIHTELVVRLEGWTDEIRGVARDRGHGRVWVESVRVRTDLPAEIHQSMIDYGAFGELFARITTLQQDESARLALLGDLADLKKKLGGSGLERLQSSLDDPQRLLDVITQAGPLVLGRFQGLGASAQS